MFVPLFQSEFSVCPSIHDIRPESHKIYSKSIVTTTPTSSTMYASASRRVAARIQKSAFSSAAKPAERRLAAPMVATAAGLTVMAVAYQEKVCDLEKRVNKHVISTRAVSLGYELFTGTHNIDFFLLSFCFLPRTMCSLYPPL
jgi:hypothetical protein